MSTEDRDLSFLAGVEESLKREVRAAILDTAEWVVVEVGRSGRPIEATPPPKPGGGFLASLTLDEALAEADAIVAGAERKRDKAREERAARKALVLSYAQRALVVALEALVRGAASP